MLYLGGVYLFTVALEGALKLKRNRTIHAEGYPAAEMKHGRSHWSMEHAVVFLIPSGGVVDKVMSNSKRSGSRRPVIAGSAKGDDEMARITSVRRRRGRVVTQVPDYLQPLVGRGAVAVAGVSHAVLSGGRSLSAQLGEER